MVKERFPEVEICYFKWDERVIISVPDGFKQTEELESYLKELFYDEERYREWMVDRLRREICREALKIKSLFGSFKSNRKDSRIQQPDRTAVKVER